MLNVPSKARALLGCLRNRVDSAEGKGGKKGFKNTFVLNLEDI